MDYHAIHTASTQVVCNHLALQVDRVAVDLWNGVVHSLERKDPWQLFLHRLHVTTANILSILRRHLVEGITQIARQVHQRTTDHLHLLSIRDHLLESVEAKQFAVLHKSFTGNKSQILQPLNEAHLQDLLLNLFPPQDWDHDDLYDTKGNRQSAGALVALTSRLVQQGKSVQQIATILRPYFDGSRVRAMRAARTYGHYVAGQVQLAAYEQLGPTIIGYEVRHLPRESARVDHTRRHGTSYYRHPQPGQLGFDVMPHPPLDRGGPHEDQQGIRWNCSCYLVPLFSSTPTLPSTEPPPEDLASQIRWWSSKDLAYQLRWWSNATEQERKALVGVRLYNEASRLLGRAPHLEELLTPAGDLLSPSEFTSESHTERAQRVLEVRKQRR